MIERRKTIEAPPMGDRRGTEWPHPNSSDKTAAYVILALCAIVGVVWSLGEWLYG